MVGNDIVCADCESSTFTVERNGAGSGKIKCANCDEVLMYAWQDDSGNAWRNAKVKEWGRP